MRNSLLIAAREWKERISSRSFILFSFIGPISVLAITFLLFTYGGESKSNWKVVIADPEGLLDDKIMANEDNSIQYSFVNSYVEIEEFRDAKMYQKFDALLEVNGKVLSNKTAYVFYREKPSVDMQTKIQYHYERRLEEIMVDEFTDLSLIDFRKIKQPLNVSFRDVYDPEDTSSDLRGWVGFFFGIVIFIFIFLFGMTILRSVTREKSNRIVEVLLASVKPRELLVGKLIGIGLAAILQFLIWILIIGIGLYLMRELIFPDMLDAANLSAQQLAIEGGGLIQENLNNASGSNQFIELVYERIQFGNMITFFILFFIAGYFFYGALFAALGSTMGSESDGQQFVIPLIVVLFLSLYAGYYSLYFPENGLSQLFHYLPFTSPVVVMVKLSQGYDLGHAYEIYVSLIVLMLSAILMLLLASRLYKNGILQFGHRLRLKHLLKWLKKS